MHRSPTRRVFSGTRLQLMTRWPQVRYLDHLATAATLIAVSMRDMEQYVKAINPQFVCDDSHAQVKRTILELASHSPIMEQPHHWRTVNFSRSLCLGQILLHRIEANAR
ncbi:hypothetical protein TNCV_2880491 [Trichonephila clavipes]|uniref:Uncharacterized protein n=1 Tax=Trichonephila clavipes TaxID=2585209 RepID=A0A8X6W2J0_TRICX|nr:hypothetical protein TNCV_2880491 [Trichonephila clavipes]